jgi:serine/threonine-protein kinase
VLPAAISADPDFRARFEREADLTATLWRPHIVGVHDRGEDDGRRWIAMDYVAGHDAAALLRDQHPSGLPPQDVAQIGTAVAEALDHARPARCRAPSGHTDTVQAIRLVGQHWWRSQSI